MEATRLAPAGRACSKFVWQSRFLTTGRFECFCIRTALSFLALAGGCGARASCGRRAKGASSFGGSGPAIDPALSKGRSVAFRARDLIRPRPKRALPVLPTRGQVPPAWAGHVVAAIGRHSSRRKCGGRRASDSEPWVGGRPFDRLAGPEFVSEFETKRDQ
jgi:hypothetical protein